MTTAVKDRNELRGPLIIRTISKLCLSLCWRFFVLQLCWTNQRIMHWSWEGGINEIFLCFMNCHTPLHVRQVFWERSLRAVHKVNVVRLYPRLFLY